MKSLTEYIKEAYEVDLDNVEFNPHDVKQLPIGPRIRKFLDKWKFKPVLDSEIEDAIKYTQFYPAKRTGDKVTAWDWYRPLNDDTYLVIQLDGSGYRPSKLTAGKQLNIWERGDKTSWILVKRFGADGYMKSPEELENLITKNKLDKKFN